MKYIYFSHRALMKNLVRKDLSFELVCFLIFLLFCGTLKMAPRNTGWETLIYIDAEWSSFVLLVVQNKCNYSKQQSSPKISNSRERIPSPDKRRRVVSPHFHQHLFNQIFKKKLIRMFTEYANDARPFQDFKMNYF